MLKDVGLQALWEKTKEMGWGILIVIGMYVIALLFQSISWWNCIEHSKSKAKFSNVFFTHVSGWAVAEIAPLSNAAGETFKGVMMRHHLEKSTIISSLLLVNTIHTFVTIKLIAIGVIVTLILIKVSLLIKILAAIGVIFLFILIFLFIGKQKKGMITSILKFLMKIKFLKNKLSKKLERAGEIDKELNNFWVNKKKNFLFAYLALWGGKIMGLLEYYLILVLLKHPVSILIIAFLFIISNVIFIVMFFVPSQIGVTEGGLNRAFKLLNMDPNYGTLLGVFRRIRVIVWTAIGLLLILFSGIRKKNNSLEANNNG